MGGFHDCWRYWHARCRQRHVPAAICHRALLPTAARHGLGSRCSGRTVSAMTPASTHQMPPRAVSCLPTGHSAELGALSPVVLPIAMLIGRLIPVVLPTALHSKRGCSSSVPFMISVVLTVMLPPASGNKTHVCNCIACKPGLAGCWAAPRQHAELSHAFSTSAKIE